MTESSERTLTERAAPASARSTFVVRHWRGELGLGWTLLSGVLVWLLLGLCLQTLQWMGLDQRWLGLIASVIIVAHPCWMAVGLWRSAGVAARSSGWVGWAGIARVCVLAMLAAGALLAISSRRSIAHSVWLTLEAPAEDQFRVLSDPTEAEVSGEITAGFTASLQSFLDAHPQVALLHLNMPGGLVYEAKRARELVEQRGIDTYVSALCASACTLVYLGGKTRFAKPGRRLGFHVGWPAVDTRAAVTYLTALGVTQQFAERMAATPNDDMWYPTDEAVVAANVVHRMTDGGDFSPSGLEPPPSLEALRDALRNNRVFRVLADKHADFFSKFLYMAHNAVRIGRSLNELEEDPSQLLTDYLERQLPRASDAALLNFARSLVRRLLEQSKMANGVCHGPARPAGAKHRAASPLSPWRGADRDTVLAELLESASDANVARLSPEALEQRLSDVSEKTLRLLGDEVPAATADSGGEAQVSCRALWAFYTSVLELPDTEAALTLRTLFADD